MIARLFGKATLESLDAERRLIVIGMTFLCAATIVACRVAGLAKYTPGVFVFVSAIPLGLIGWGWYQDRRKGKTNGEEDLDEE